jgi:uncharacterized protein (DUF1697 family)
MRYAAFLRGVNPMNLKMPDLKRAIEAAGFLKVKTVLSSGNVVFDAASASPAAIERRAEAAMQRSLGRTFPTLVRSIDALRELISADPYRALRVAPGAKRVVTFLRERPKVRIRLPVSQDGAHILAIRDAEAFSAYVRSPRGPVFMTLIERTLGKDVTTRTWDTVRKVAAS